MPPRDLEARIGHRFSSRHLLEEALRHGSAAAADGERSYERLKFLGDAVLNLCVAREVYRMLPLAGEGVLTRARTAAINNRNLVRVGERIGLPEALTTDPSVRKKGSGVTRKMVADAVEAVAGAVFLDGGFDAAAAFVRGHFRLDDLMGELVAGFDANYQSPLFHDGHSLHSSLSRTSSGPQIPHTLPLFPGIGKRSLPQHT